MANLTQDQIAAMFGEYTRGVDPSLYGGYTPEYWRRALYERAVATDPSLQGNAFFVDWGGIGTQYLAPESYVQGGGGQYLGLGGYSAYLDEPYNEERLGFDAPLGAWVWGKEGEPVKVEGSWNRNSDQDPASYGWQWVSAFDPETVNIDAIDGAYRNYISPEGHEDGWNIGNVPAHAFLDPNKEYTLSKLPNLYDDTITYTPTTRTYRDEYGVSEVRGWEYTGIDSNSDTGLPTQIFVTPEEMGRRYVMGLPANPEDLQVQYPIYYLDPTKSTWGAYQDPAGRESTQMLSAMGYLPNKGDFHYESHWYTPVAAALPGIALGIATVASGGAAGPALAAYMGNMAYQAAERGDILGAVLSSLGALGGVASFASFLSNTTAVQGLAASQGVDASNWSLSQLEAFAQSQGTSLSQVGSATAAGKVADFIKSFGNLGANEVTQSAGNILSDVGITGFTNELLREGLTSGIYGGAKGVLAGGDFLTSTAFGTLKSAVGNALDIAWDKGPDVLNKTISALSGGDRDTLSELSEQYGFGLDPDSLDMYSTWAGLETAAKTNPTFMQDLQAVYNSNDDSGWKAFNEMYNTEITPDDFGDVAGFFGYASNIYGVNPDGSINMSKMFAEGKSDIDAIGDMQDMGDKAPSATLTQETIDTVAKNTNTTTTPKAPLSNQASSIIAEKIMGTDKPTQPTAAQTTQQPDLSQIYSQLGSFERKELPENQIFTGGYVPMNQQYQMLNPMQLMQPYQTVQPIQSTLIQQPQQNPMTNDLLSFR